MTSIAWVESALGSQSKVRILRALCREPDRWFTEAEISRTIQMSPNTVNLAMADLVRSGAVELVVLGRSNQLRLRSDSPQAQAIVALFGSEASLIERLQKAVSPLVGAKESCILFGSAVHGTMGRDSDIDLLLVAPTKDLAADLDVRITAAARRVHPGTYRIIHLTPKEVRQRWTSTLLEAIRRDGVRLGGKPLEIHP